MNYEAAVLGIYGTTRHLRDGRDITFDVRRVEIEEQGGLYSLKRYDERGVVVADTAHLSLAEARRQAEFEYDLEWASEHLSE